MAAWIHHLHSFTWMKIFVIYTRYLIGFAFVFASIIKIQGERFTRIPSTQPVGYFFEALYQSGFYWNFLGWCQFLSAALLMTQRFATLGAMFFFPVMLNVFMITHSIDFGSGTPVITTLMLLATIGLLLWDYQKWIFLFYPDHRIKLDLSIYPKDEFMADPVWVTAGFVFLVLTITLNLLHNPPLLWITLILINGICAFVLGLFRERKRKSVRMEQSIR